MTQIDHVFASAFTTSIAELFFSFPPAYSIVFSDQQTSSSLNGLLYIQKTVEIQLDHTQNWGRTSVFYLLKLYSLKNRINLQEIKVCITSPTSSGVYV